MVSPFRRVPLLFVLSAMLLSSCVLNPVTGKREVHMISREAELRLGNESRKEIIREYGRYNNPTVQAYVNEVGNRIVAVCDRHDIPIDFVILDIPLVNAFSVPGTVFLTRGILETIDDEAELATVIGHEVGHITGYHAVKMMQRAYGYGSIATLAAIAGTIYAPAFRNANEAAAYYQTLYRGVGLLSASFLYGYGRQFELEADRSGLRYAILAGYDPDAMISFFKRLDRLGEDDLTGLGIFLRSHPPTPDRIRQIKKILAAVSEGDIRTKRVKGENRKQLEEMSAVLRSTTTTLRDNFEKYQDIVRSMPRKDLDTSGVIHGRVYRNSRLGLELSVPEQWKLGYSYGRTLISFYGPDGKAEGELTEEKIQPEVLSRNEPSLSTGPAHGFAGVALSTEPVTARQWAESIEPGLKMKKRTGREVDTYPAGPAYAATYEGQDRVGRPAFYKILYVVHGKKRGEQEGFILSFACPDENYLDYLVDCELIFTSLRWTKAGG